MTAAPTHNLRVGDLLDAADYTNHLDEDATRALVTQVVDRLNEFSASASGETFHFSLRPVTDEFRAATDYEDFVDALWSLEEWARTYEVRLS